MTKTIDGLDTGDFDSLYVAENGLIEGNLTVEGTLNATISGGATSGTHFTATDSTNQYRTNSSGFEFKSNAANPTFRFKDQADATSSTMLVAGRADFQRTVNADATTKQSNTANNTNASASMRAESNAGKYIEIMAHSDNHSTRPAQGALLTSGCASMELITDTTSVPVNIKVGGTQRLGVTNTAVTTTVPISAGGSVTGTSLVSSGGASVTGETTTGTLNATSTTPATSSTTGAIRTAGGISAAQNIWAGTSLRVQNGTWSSNGNDVFINASSDAIHLRPTTGTGASGMVNTTTEMFVQRQDNTGRAMTVNKTNGLTTVNGTMVSNRQEITRAATEDSDTVYTSGSRRLIVGSQGSADVTHPNSALIRAENGQTNLDIATDSASTPIRMQIASNTRLTVGNTSISATVPVISTGSFSGTDLVGTGNLSVTGTSTLIGNISSAGTVVTTNGTDSLANASSGSIRTTGGLAVGKTAFVADGVRFNYGKGLYLSNAFAPKDKILDVQFDSPLSGDTTYLYTPGTSGQSSSTYVLGVNADRLRLPQTTQATSTTTGALVVGGGVGIGGNLHVGGTITGGSVVYGTTSSGTFAVTNGTGTTLTVASTTEATSTTTGAAIFEGGVAIKKNLHVGGTITGGSVVYGTTSSGTFAVTNGTGTTLTVASTTESTSLTTGSAIYEGGVAVKKNMQIGGETVSRGKLTVDATIGDNAMLLRNNSASGYASVQFANNAGTNFWMGLGGSTSDVPNEFYLFTAGGGHLFKGFTDGTMSFLNGTESTSTTTGAVRLSGGLGVAKNVHIGGNLTVAGTSTLNISQFTGSGATYTSPAFTFTNTTNPASLGATNTFFSQPVDNGEEAVIAVGTGLGANQATQVVFKNAAVAADREAKLGLFGTGTGLTVKQAGLSINGSPFFGFKQGTWTPSMFRYFLDSGEADTGAPCTHTIQTGFYQVIGNRCTITFHIVFGYGYGNAGGFGILLSDLTAQGIIPLNWNVPKTPGEPAPYYHFTGVSAQPWTEIGGLAKPHNYCLERTGDFENTKVVRLYNGNNAWTGIALQAVSGQVCSGTCTFIVE